MDNRIVLKARTDIEIVTHNRYLRWGLLPLLPKCGQQSPKEECTLKIVLIDIDCLGMQQAQWQLISNKIQQADRFALMSFSDSSFDNVPHLAVNAPVPEIQKRLVQLLHRLINTDPPNHQAFFSRLSYTEKELVLFLTCEFSVRDIHEAMGLSEKTIYRIKSQVMKKYGLGNRLDLHNILMINDFFRFHSVRGKSGSDTAEAFKMKTARHHTMRSV